jgi:transposase
MSRTASVRVSPRRESAQLRELKRRNRLLEQENEVPPRAAAFVDRGINPK